METKIEIQKIKKNKIIIIQIVNFRLFANKKESDNNKLSIEIK